MARRSEGKTGEAERSQHAKKTRQGRLQPKLGGDPPTPQLPASGGVGAALLLTPETELLTPPQLKELERLGREPQRTYGSSRTRLQNTLVEKKLANYEDDGGLCVITTKGSALLKGAQDGRRIHDQGK